MLVDSIVYLKGKDRFDMVGQSLPTHLTTTRHKISQLLTHTLYKYSVNAFNEAGFNTADCKCEVYTIDADRLVNDRSYCVRFINTKGGYIELVGILLSKGKPMLDHGFAIGVL